MRETTAPEEGKKSHIGSERVPFGINWKEYQMDVACSAYRVSSSISGYGQHSLSPSGPKPATANINSLGRPIPVWHPEDRSGSMIWRNGLSGATVTLIAIKSYFDGSYNAKRMTLACLSADEITWGEIEENWEKVRKARGNPRCIHMTDAMALKGDFENWSPDDRDYLVDGLLNVFLVFRGFPRIKSFTCTVDLIAHVMVRKQRRIPLVPRICARMVFPQMMEWYAALPDLDIGAVEAYFDRTEEFMRHIEPDWRNNKIRHRHPQWILVKAIAPVEMEDSPAIQMADVIAWGRNRLESGSHWQHDPHYATAVRAANTIPWMHCPIDEQVLSTVNFREEGYAAINIQGLKAQNTAETSDEFKKFDKMMRELMHVPHGEVKSKQASEKKHRAKRKRTTDW